MTILERAARYLDSMPPGISGQNGHSATYAAASALINGFALSIDDARALLHQFNARCIPPWSEAELEHKLKDALTRDHDKPRGYLANESSSRPPSSAPPKLISYPSTFSRGPAPAKTPNVPAKRYDGTPPVDLPDPILDGAKKLLQSVFLEGEGVRIARAVLNFEGREIPDGSGIILTREQWIERLDQAGGPNGIFHSMGDDSALQPGIYISVNPMIPGGSGRDEDVTSHRHLLIEFDNDSLETQWAIIVNSDLPCAAVISSGGKSIHAWVRLDAKDLAEYRERTQMVFDALAKHNPDPKNKNPARFSRLPDCKRFSNRQELLSLRRGAESFESWIADIHAASIGRHTPTVDLLAWRETSHTSDTLLGSRYLCRGGSCLIVGPSGIGKSSLSIQFAAAWAVGRPMFGITPTRPLKSLIIQAENDDGDLAEMIQGIYDGLGFMPDDSLFLNNIVCIRDTIHTGYDFTRAVWRLVVKHKPDLVWFDPLLSFVGGDISRQEVCSQFLRGWLNPISEATGVTWMAIHHTGKPPGDKKAREGWTATDYAYAGIGSSELTNWARAVMSLRSVNDNTFELRLAKRGSRAKATHPDGQPTKIVWLRHSDGKIWWEQITPPEDSDHSHSSRRDQAQTKERKLTIPESLATSNLHSFISGCSQDGESLRTISARLNNWAAGQTPAIDASRGSCDKAIGLMVANGKLSKINNLYFKGKNS